MPSSRNPSDEELIARVAAGAQEALGPLYGRYARLVFNVAVQTLDRAAAEEITQDVFLVVWRRANVFDARRGTFRSWLLQITHFRVLNELRRRGRQPQLAADPDQLLVAEIADRSLSPADQVAAGDRRAAVRAALATLPETQRQAVGLAVLDDLTHEQVAAELAIPLGTAKTRIRSGVRRLRGTLVARAAALALIIAVVLLGVREHATRDELRRFDRALSLVTASDTENVRLASAAGVPPATHARYRGRAGVPIAVLTLSSFPAAPPGRTYQAWARYGDRWLALGTVTPDAEGSARLIAEDARLAIFPEAVRVTLEPIAGSPAPAGAVIVAWEGPASVPE
jgi:RNA polymerase sigma-70 factor, ECF subfamily